MFSFHFANWYANHPHLQFAICNCKSSDPPDKVAASPAASGHEMSPWKLFDTENARKCFLKIVLYWKCPKLLFDNCFIVNMPPNTFFIENCCTLKMPQKAFWQLFYTKNATKCFLKFFYSGNAFFLENCCILKMPPKYFLKIFIANVLKCLLENWFRGKTLWILKKKTIWNWKYF